VPVGWLLAGVLIGIMGSLAEQVVARASVRGKLGGNRVCNPKKSYALMRILLAH